MANTHADDVLALGIMVQHLTEKNRQLKEKIVNLKEQIGSDATYLVSHQNPLGWEQHMVKHSRKELVSFVHGLFNDGTGWCPTRYQNMMSEFEEKLDRVHFDHISYYSAAVFAVCDCHDAGHRMRAFTFTAFSKF